MIARGIGAVIILGLLFLTTPWPVEWMRRSLFAAARKLENEPPTPECASTFSTVVVLGAGLTAETQSTARMIGRLEAARRFVGDHSQVKNLIVTGGPTYHGSSVTEAEAALVYLRAQGWDEARCALLSEGESHNTFENAVFTRRLMQREGLTPDIVLVTDRPHLPRAVPTFRKQGFRVCAVPAVEPAFAEPLPPAGFGVRNVQRSLGLGYELLGGAVYRLLGRID